MGAEPSINSTDVWVTTQAPALLHQSYAYLTAQQAKIDAVVTDRNEVRLRLQRALQQLGEYDSALPPYPPSPVDSPPAQAPPTAEPFGFSPSLRVSSPERHALNV